MVETDSEGPGTFTDLCARSLNVRLKSFKMLVPIVIVDFFFNNTIQCQLYAYVKINFWASSIFGIQKSKNQKCYCDLVQFLKKSLKNHINFLMKNTCDENFLAPKTGSSERAFKMLMKKDIKGVVLHPKPSPSYL